MAARKKKATEDEGPLLIPVAPTGAAHFVPQAPTLETLRSAASHCTGCDLYKKGTQTVFGEGLRRAPLMLVGEQPGDKEDLAGRPFVGPAGRLLDQALASAGIDRSKAYVTNVVKHFKWEPRGKRRIHQKPNVAEIRACSPWVHAEIAVVQPDVLVCLGATAAQALLGSGFKLTARRGELVESTLAKHVMATVHPSALLRAPDEDTRQYMLARFVEDLSKAARLLSS